MSTGKIKYYRLLTADLFLLSLVTLLLNDFILKFKFPGQLTGKLSDFSGLFAFPYFISVFFPRQKKTIYILTCVFFTLWKLPISDRFITFINSFNLLHFHRIKDPTDLFALMIIPFSFIYFNQQFNLKGIINKLQLYTISMVSLFAFTATNLGNVTYGKQLSLNHDFIVPVTRTSLLTEYLSPGMQTFNNTNDSVLYIPVRLPDKSKIEITYQVILKSKYTDSTLIFLEKVVHVEIENGGMFSGPDEDYVKEIQSYKSTDYIQIFNTLVVDKIKSKNKRLNIYYIEKKYKDSNN